MIKQLEISKLGRCLRFQTNVCEKDALAYGETYLTECFDVCRTFFSEEGSLQYVDYTVSLGRVRNGEVDERVHFLRKFTFY
jgi:hypothetical protein